MMRSSSNFGNLVGILIFAVIFTVIVSTFLNALFNPRSIVEVTDCTLTSDTVNSGELTSITITLKSDDEENAHVVRIEFSSHELVRFLLGSVDLPRKDSIYYYEETLNPKATHTQFINIRPTLAPGISELEYRITAIFFIDGEQFYNKNLDLTVQLP